MVFHAPSELDTQARKVFDFDATSAPTVQSPESCMLLDANNQKMLELSSLDSASPFTGPYLNLYARGKIQSDRAYKIPATSLTTHAAVQSLTLALLITRQCVECP